MIETISDLKKASKQEISDAIRNIDIRGVVTRGLVNRGRRPGYTMDQWRKEREKRESETCPTCAGRGHVHQKLRTVGTIHASGATRCVVSLYYDVTGEIAPAEELKPELLITFEIGHAIHGLVQEVLHEELGDAFADEVRVDLQEAMILNGSADGIIWLPRCRVLLEIKTISENEYGKLRKPKPDHLIQAVGLYAKGLDVPFISFLYISKGWPHDIKEYVVPYDERVFQNWYSQWGIKVEEALEEGVPPRAENVSAYTCGQCKYNSDCPQALGMRDRFKKK